MFTSFSSKYGYELRPRVGLLSTPQKLYVVLVVLYIKNIFWEHELHQNAVPFRGPPIQPKPSRAQTSNSFIAYAGKKKKPFIMHPNSQLP